MPAKDKGPLESSITKSIITTLKKLKRIWMVKTHGGLMQAAGLPDIMGCYMGRFFALEVKRPGEKPTRLQQFVLEAISFAGGIAKVVFSAADALAALEITDIIYCDRMGHLIVDGNKETLHAFALQIGLRREWYQDKGWKSHYDLTTPNMILKAIEAGAKLIKPQELVKILQARKEDDHG